MRVFVCVDQKDGLLFNNRRPSRDRVVIEDIEKMSDGQDIAMSEYSAKLFEGYDHVVVTENFKDYENVFSEQADLKELAWDELIVYRWDKVYPSDVKLDVDLSSLNLKDVSTLQGYSHDTILKEVYVR
ncbi:hypothetical protein C815_01080 [Firmicutes bacterium M10-2]|nr:hypothetical protein C815_01080 [Firmicutes bacterium M10-2]